MPSPDRIDPTTAVATVRRLLTDFTRCPSCGTVLGGQRCPSCGLDLTGPDAQRVGELSMRAAQVLTERDGVIGQMRARAKVEARPSAPPPLPSASPPPPAPVAVAEPSSSVGVHGLLVGLGALLLSVAAVGFLVFSWHVLSLPGRAGVIAAATLGVLGTASWMRGRLPETAEAVGALGVVLVLADAWAVRRTGLFGADRPDLLSYAAAATAVSAVLLGGWALLSRVRAGSWAAVTLGPVALLLAAVRLDDRLSGPVPVLAIGFLLVAGVASAREGLPAEWQAERWLLRAYAAIALLAAWAPAAVGSPGSGRAVLVLLAAAAIAAVQARADQAIGDRFLSVLQRRGWSLAAGGLAGTAALQAGLALADVLDRDDVTALVPLVALPVLAVVAAAALPARPGAAIRRTAFAAGVVVVAGVAAVPVLALAVWLPLRAGLIGAHAWTAGPGTRLGDLDPSAGAALASWAVTLTGLSVLAVGTSAAVRRGGWPTWLRRPVAVTGAVTAGLALVVLPLLPSAPVVGAVAGLLLISVAAAVLVGSGRTVRPGWIGAGLLLSGVTGILGVVTAWSVRGLSIPVTLLGVAGLLLARRAAAGPARAVLAGAALLAGVVVVGASAGVAGVASPLWIVWAGLVGGLSTAALLGLPRWWPSARPGRADWTGADRLAAAAPGVVALVLGLLATLSDGTTPAVGGADWPRPVLLAVALLFASTGVGAARPAIGHLVPVLPPFCALVTAPLLGALVGAVRAAVGPSGGPASSLLWAGAATVGALVTAAVVLSGRVDPARRVAAELGILGTAGIGLALVTGPEALWPVLLVLGAGATALAATGDRPQIGWLAGLLLTGSTWTRLAVGHVSLVEAYALPPAFALLLLAGYRFYRDRATDPARALLPVATVGLTPSILVAADGPALRPAVLIAVAAILVVAGRPVQRRGLEGLGSVLAAIGVLTAAATAALRAGSTLWEWAGSGTVPLTGVEVWTGPAAVILVIAGLAIRARATELTVGRWRFASPPVLAGLVLFAGPSLVAAESGFGGLRVAVVFAVSAVAAMAGGTLSTALPVRAGLVPEATGLAVAAALTGLSLSIGPAEVWTVPLAALLLIQGWSRFPAGAERPAMASSWPAYAPGLLVLLVPSLYLGSVASDGPVLRTVGLITLAGATLVIGTVHRLQAPVLLGAGALGLQAVVLLLPWLSELSGAVPVWGWLALVGLALIVLGARYEARIRQLKAVRSRLAALR